MDSIAFTPIGVIRTPHESLEGMPIQPTGAKGVLGRIELKPELGPGLKDLDGFSHAILLYCFHESRGYELELTPFMDVTPRGLFSTRAPRRPNPIGLSVVRVLSVDADKGLLEVQDVDLLDGTPILDIKPLIPKVDCPGGELRAGWLQEAQERMKDRRADDRFIEE